MKLKLRVFLIILTLVLLFITWTLTTERGLKTLVFAGKNIVPGTLVIKNIQGTLFKPVILEGVEYRNDRYCLKAESIHIKPEWVSMWEKALILDNIRIEKASLYFADPSGKADPGSWGKNYSGDTDKENLGITILRGKISFQPRQNACEIILDEFHGQFQGKSLFIRGGLKWNKNLVIFQKMFFEWGSYRLKIQTPKNEPDSNTANSATAADTMNTATTTNTENIENTAKTLSTASINFFLPFDASNPYYGFGEIQYNSNTFSVKNLNILQAQKLILTAKGHVSVPKLSLHLPAAEQKIQGSYEAELIDLSPIYKIVPIISRLKAKPVISGDISGTLAHPIVGLHGNVGNAIFSIPKQKVTIKHFQLNVEGTLEKVLNITSSGTLGGNTFYIKGWVSPFKEGLPAMLELSGKKLRLLNSPTQFMLASADLHLNYGYKTLEVFGNVNIDDAKINIKEDSKSIIFSEDVLLVGDQIEALHPEVIKIIPHITVKVENKAHFKGYGLDAFLKGKIKIAQRKDGLYTGEGKITFTEGKYRLPNGIGQIHKGHLFYPSGRLLKDPILDIRVIQKSKGSLDENSEVGITVEGTLQKPVYHLYSNEALKKSEILSRLGGGGAEREDDKQRQALSQSAVLLGGGANPIVENIQTKLKLDEFGIQSQETKYISTQDGNDTALVVGKSLSERVYLKYIQGVWVPSSTLKLLYFLSPRAAVSVESSTGGCGGDISFSTERN